MVFGLKSFTVLFAEQNQSSGWLTKRSTTCAHTCTELYALGQVDRWLQLN